jgi:hypothetical protein
LSKSSAVLRNHNPSLVTASYRSVSALVVPATLACPAPHRLGWLAGILRQIGDLIFMPCDEEAYWRGWAIERRHAGLGRRYRDPVFDTVTECPLCRGLGITVEESLCVKCSGTGRIALDQPPFPFDG